MKFAGSKDWQKVLIKFEIWPDRTNLSLSTEKAKHCTCPGHSPFSFSQIFMRLADNQYSDKLKTGPRCNIFFEVSVVALD